MEEITRVEESIKVLIIDDSELIGSRLIELLSALPQLNILQQAKTVKEGLHLYRQHNPNIILLDLNLPDGSGLEVLQALKAAHTKASIIMISNFDNYFYKKKSLELGADFYLDKATDFFLVLNIIGEIITAKN